MLSDKLINNLMSMTEKLSPSAEQKFVHNQHMSITEREFTLLSSLTDTSLAYWLYRKSEKQIPNCGPAILKRSHFDDVAVRFPDMYVKNVPTAAYNKMHRSLAYKPMRGVVEDQLAGSEQNQNQDVSLDLLLKMNMEDIKRLFSSGLISFQLFCNAVMIAIEEASADVALAPQDPTRS